MNIHTTHGIGVVIEGYAVHLPLRPESLLFVILIQRGLVALLRAHVASVQLIAIARAVWTNGSATKQGTAKHELGHPTRRT